MRRAAVYYLTLLTVWPVTAVLRADPPDLLLFPEFADLRLTALHPEGPDGSGGTTGLSILWADTVLNHQPLPAGTILSMFGSVSGGEQNRVYAVDPNTGHTLPDVSVSYAPAAVDGAPDGGMVLLPGDSHQFLGIQYHPMAIFLGEMEEDGPGTLHDIEYLPGDEFPNGGGLGLLDENTLFVTSWAEKALYTVDFEVEAGQLSLSNLSVVNPSIPGLGPDGVAVIPPNAAGALADYAGNLVMARFHGTTDGFITIMDPQGNYLATLARYYKNDGFGLLGPDGVAFGPDGSLFISDFGETIFKLEIPEPGTIWILLAGIPICACRRS